MAGSVEVVPSSTSLLAGELRNIESLANEAIRCAILAVANPNMLVRARETLLAFHQACRPDLVLKMLSAYPTSNV
jgi:hypothetical protein